jgi:AcrR family transcriptional regulator
MKGKIETKIKDQTLIGKKRQIIIRAANKLFVKKGFHKTTINDIANESGLTPGTLYNYIRKKEDILFLLHEDIQKKVMKQLDVGIQQASDIHNMTERVFKSVLDVFNKNRKTCRLIFVATASQTKISLEVLLNRESQIIDKIRDLIAEGVRKGVFDVIDERLAASMIHFLIFYQSLTNWDIKTMGMKDSEVASYVLSCIYRILGFDKEAHRAL